MIYKIVDNFLNKKEFDEISDFIMESDIETNFLWRYISDIEGLGIHSNLFYMTHELYRGEEIVSSYKNYPDDEIVPEYKDPFYDILNPIFSVFKKIGLTKLWRVKCNLFPNTETLQEHAYHVDHKEEHIGALLSLNTCDGYTKFKDGSKVDSIANRIVFFEGSGEHASTTTTNTKARFNINFNFGQRINDIETLL